MSYPTNLHAGKDYTALADRPTATAFGAGKAVISNSSYYIDSNSNGVEWFSRGSSTLLSYRPSAALFGKGEWVVDGVTKYLCDGVSWTPINQTRPLQMALRELTEGLSPARWILYGDSTGDADT